MSENVENELVALIKREINSVPPDVNAGTSLFEGGLDLDSFAVVDLVSRIESHFAIHLSDDDFRPENFADIRTLAGVIATYLDGRVNG